MKYTKKFVRKYIGVLIPLLVLLLHQAMYPVHAQDGKITVVTENFPPYSFLDTESGEVEGLSTEIMQAVFKEIGEDFSPRVYPWARTLKEAEEGQNTIIYSIGRNAKRENSYQWVGTIANYGWHLYALPGSEITLDTLEDAKKYMIGTVRNDAREALLQEHGFQLGKNLDRTNNYAANFRKLQRGRIDLWAMPDAVAYYFLKEEFGLNSSAIKSVYTMKTGEYYMAFGNKVNNELFDKVQKALQTIKENGVYDEITHRYN